MSPPYLPAQAPDWRKRRSVRPALLVVAAFSAHADAITRSKEKLAGKYGIVGLASEPFAFHHTKYYQKTMGANLQKQFFAFSSLVPEDCLPDVKNATNKLEDDLAALMDYAEVRPVNLDPGLLTLGKFLLATTKDQAHRIYLRDGIYAEVTLRYQDGEFHPWPWTYADYREPAYHEFLIQAREFYRERLASSDD